MRLAIPIGVVVSFAVSPAVAQQPQAVPPVEFTVEVLGSKLVEFTIAMDDYAKLRRSLEEGLPPLVVTDQAGEIQRAERLLAARIRRARAGADRGDIFTDDIRRGFRQLLRPVITAATCEAIADDNPGEFGWDVNGEYPKDRTVSTVPPSVLAALPRLPDDVFYRFLGRDLILHDTRANIILDRIDDSFRCR
jgi:hypothetical protein